MALSKSHYINTGKHGVLDGTSQQDVDNLFVELANKKKIVLHFHGGLVSAASGMASAERLQRDCYEPSGAYPVFFIWQSGLLEIIKHNVTKISGEAMFQILLKWVLKFAAGKLGEAIVGKSPAVQLPDDMEIHRELERIDQEVEPFHDWPIADNISEITEEEEKAFERALENDNDFQATVEAIANSAVLVPKMKTDGAKGVVVEARSSIRTLMSPEIVEQLTKDVEQAHAEGAKGIVIGSKLLLAAGMILVRVVRRFVKHRDHGLYPTAMEEILREFYVANIGTAIWSAMKQETADTFKKVKKPPPRGGWYFTKKLQELLVSCTPRPEISLVGHSTGAVFINNLLAHVQAMQSEAANPIPQDFTFSNIIFLAPACTFENFRPTVTKYRKLFDNFRMFTMTDEAEIEDRLVPNVYTRSLLYFVAGVLEPADAVKVDFDKPIVGMKRYYADTSHVYNLPEIQEARTFLDSIKDSAVWCPVATSPGPGLFSTSRKHGDFDDDANTLASVRYILEN